MHPPLSFTKIPILFLYTYFFYNLSLKRHYESSVFQKTSVGLEKLLPLQPNKLLPARQFC
jgi:hypothetical protein